MFMILRCATGLRLSGVVLATGDGLLRIAVERQDDAVELRLIGYQWTSEDGMAVEVEAVIANNCNVTVEPFLEVHPRTAKAAS